MGEMMAQGELQNYDITVKYPGLLDEDTVANYDFESCWTRLNPDAEYEERDVAFALAKTRANLSAAARLLGRSRRVVETWVTTWNPLLDFKVDIEEEDLDSIESTVKTSAINGDGASGRFMLQTRGKARGYVTRTEQTGPGGKPLVPTRNFEKADDDDLDEIMNRIPPGDDE